MFFDNSKDIPENIKKVKLEKWYSNLNDRDKVKIKRYLNNIDVNSKIEFLTSLIRLSNQDNNYSFSIVIGEQALEENISSIERFDILEDLIIAYFNTKNYEKCIEACNTGLSILHKERLIIQNRSDGELPEQINCRSYKINVTVGVWYDYDEGDRILEEYYESNLISKEDLAHRKQSHKIFRLQKSFDGIYTIKLKEE